IWYVVRREGLTIPYPIQMEFSPGETPLPPSPDADTLLAAHPRFRPGIPAAQAAKPVVLQYAAGETVHSARRRFAGFGLVLSGRATLLASDKAGQPVRIGTIGPGECLGDQLAVGSARDDIDIVAEPGLQIVALDPRAVGDLLDRSPTLAAEIGDALEARRQAANAVAQAL
ncbi:MAG: cyclic nucleotide-binding domain-containing protein, partial [Planctomycetia bacterium]